jgi:hypothetical protein
VRSRFEKRLLLGSSSNHSATDTCHKEGSVGI